VAHGLNAIDWSAPWHAPWRLAGQRAARHIAKNHNVAEGLNAAQAAGLVDAIAPLRHAEVQGRPRQFVAQTCLPAETPYETHIFQTGQIPTRDGLHDFFNGLVWLSLPCAKERLNALHTAHWRHTPLGRGPARDGLTLLDESGALFVGSDAVWDALCAKDWQRAMVDLRSVWAHTQIVLLGHSLPEKLVTPRKPITAHLYRVHTDSMALADIDLALALQLDAAHLATKPFAHLPVLGIPGWWPANENPDFYTDVSVFRTLRA